MAKAKQLPSGSWRVQVYDKESGKYLSFTSQLPGKAGKNEAEYMATAKSELIAIRLYTTS